MRVKCLDNSLHSDQLQVGGYYDLEARDRDNFRLVGIKGLFHYKRFATLPIVHVEVKEAPSPRVSGIPVLDNWEPGNEKVQGGSPKISDASFPEPIKRYRGREQ